jgi:hypothetical protein
MYLRFFLAAPPTSPLTVPQPRSHASLDGGRSSARSTSAARQRDMNTSRLRPRVRSRTGRSTRCPASVQSTNHMLPLSSPQMRTLWRPCTERWLGLVAVTAPMFPWSVPSWMDDSRRQRQQGTGGAHPRWRWTHRRAFPQAPSDLASPSSLSLLCSRSEGIQRDGARDGDEGGAVASTTWRGSDPRVGASIVAGEEEGRPRTVFAGGVGALHLSISVERSSISGSPFASSVGEELRSAQCRRRAILSI